MFGLSNNITRFLKNTFAKHLPLQPKRAVGVTCVALSMLCYGGKAHAASMDAKGAISAKQHSAIRKLPKPFSVITMASCSDDEGGPVTNLYVWRHGETGSNAAKILSGGGDIEAALTEKGHRQAFDLATKIAKLQLPLQAIYSSDLSRAMDTAQPIQATFSTAIESVIPAPQLREILHGKYELCHGDERKALASLMFKKELEHLKKDQGSIQKKIEDGSLDRFHFSRIHPMSGRVATEEGTIIDVVKFFQYKIQEPETPYELYHRIHAEFIRIAEETQDHGMIDVGISTHGAVLATLINVAQYSKGHHFIPLHYQSDPLYCGSELAMPGGAHIANCALAHFRYYHESGKLQFCGMLE